MHRTNLAVAALVAGVLAMTVLPVPAADAPAADAKATVTDIKYDDLAKLVSSHKGKVVVVDFWGEY